MPSETSVKEILGKLVSFDTTSHKTNIPCAEWIRDYLAGHGIESTMLPAPDGIHVTVNGKRVTIPSYRLRIGDVIEVTEKAKQLALVLEAIKSAERDVPDYVNADHNKMTAALTRIPALSDVPYPVQMEPNLVVEFYSR